ncbi:MAG: hypothetical protein AVDCRST_MAG51-3373, partial [uncultured Ramlibacter sp.]
HREGVGAGRRATRAAQADHGAGRPEDAPRAPL